MQVHTVAFGYGAAEHVLRSMASQPSYFHRALDGASLVREFMNIAQTVSENHASESLTRTSAAALESLKANNADNQTAIARMAEESALSKLTPALRDKVRELFNKMDTDGDGAVSEADAISFFKSDAKLHARAMLNEVRVRPVLVLFSSFPEPGPSRTSAVAGGHGP